MDAVLLAAGNGERMWPLTEKRSKTMLHLCGKPIIGHLIDALRAHGIEKIVVVARKGDTLLVDYCTKKGAEVVFQDGSKKGSAAALLAAKKAVRPPFLVLAADSVLDPSIIRSVIDAHEGEATVALKRVDDPSRYGVAEVLNGRIAKIEEKPLHPSSDLANISVYCFGGGVFDKLESLTPSPRGEYELVDVLLGARAVLTEGAWKDVGYPWDLLDALPLILSHMEARTGDVVESTINGKVVMEEGAKIIHSYVEGDVYIGKNTVVGPNAYIKGPASIGENCAVGVGTTVKNSVLGNNVKAKHLAYIGDSVVGDNVNFGAGTQIANFRFDESHVKVFTKKGWRNTGRRKFGAVVGDGTKFGVLSSVMPGKLIGCDCWIYSGVSVNRNIPSNKRVFSRIVLEEADVEQG